MSDLPKLRRYWPVGESTRGEWEIEGSWLFLENTAVALRADSVIPTRLTGWKVRVSFAMAAEPARQAVEETGLRHVRFRTRREALIAAAALIATDHRVRLDDQPSPTTLKRT